MMHLCEDDSVDWASPVRDGRFIRTEGCKQSPIIDQQLNDSNYPIRIVRLNQNRDNLYELVHLVDRSEQ